METLPLLRMLVSLAATLGLMLLLAMAYKRFGSPFTPPAPRAEPRLKVLATQRLNPTTTLYLISKDDTEEHLLAVTAAQTTVISRTEKKNRAKVKA